MATFITTTTPTTATSHPLKAILYKNPSQVNNHHKQGLIGCSYTTQAVKNNQGQISLVELLLHNQLIAHTVATGWCSHKKKRQAINKQSCSSEWPLHPSRPSHNQSTCSSWNTQVQSPLHEFESSWVPLQIPNQRKKKKQQGYHVNDQQHFA